MADALPIPEKLALLAQLLLETRLVCVACIENKSGSTVAEIEHLMARVQHTFCLKIGTDQCGTCGRSTLVYSLFARD